jgi:hypothetical protein
VKRSSSSRVRAALLLAAPVLAASACAPSPSPVAPVAAASVDAAPPPPAREAPPQDDLATTLCAGRTPCSIRRNRSAGRGEHGEALSVVSLDLGRTPAQGGSDDGDGGADDGATAAGEANDLQESATEDETSPAFQGPCHSFEYWLVTDTAGAAPRLLASACNDGYGASMTGIDVMTIGPDAFTCTRGGGSNWRWSYTSKITLSPLGLVSSESSGRWVASVNTITTTWDWVGFAGTVSWYAAPCDDKGQLPAEPAEGKPYESILIPRVPLPEAFRGGGYRETALGACAVAIDGTGRHGYLAFGAGAGHEAASVRAVLSDHDELFVEVHDAHPSGASARWVADDHLEIWIAPVAAGFGDQCIPSKEPPPKQWGIRVADGKVFAGYGSPRPSELTVERAATQAGITRLRIGVPHEYSGITVAYSDGDGVRQQRLFATSIVKKGVPETVGAAIDIKPDHAVCEVKEGRLEPRMTYAPKADDGYADETP